MIGGPEDVSIVFSPQGANLQILHRVRTIHRGKPSITIMNRVDVEFPEEVSFYQLNNLEKTPFQFHVVAYDKPLPSSPTSVYFRAERPDQLSGYRIGYSGGSLYPDAVEKIKETKRDLHRCHIEFLVDGQPYSIDVSFRFKLKTRRVFGVPGMP